MQLYFAYGSNLLPQQMQDRCPDHRFCYTAELRDYRFLIGARGYATIERSVGNSVYGVVYELSLSDEEELDRREGVALGSYPKHYLTVWGPQGSIAEVLVYVDPQVTPGLPRPGYMEKILSGASHYQLPLAYQRFLQSFVSSELIFESYGHEK